MTSFFNPPVPAQAQMDGENIRRLFYLFLNEFQAHNEEKQLVYYYREEAYKMVKNKRTTMYIDFKHLMERDSQLVEALNVEFYKYQPFCIRALHKFMNDFYKDQVQNKMFYLAFYNYPEIDNIRDLKSNRIGKLMALMGTITKATEVRPELLIGTFICVVCRAKVRDVEQQFRFTEPKLCSNPNCSNKTQWELDSTDGCQFTDWQKIRVQENANDIPAGSMPRSIDVILRNEQVERGQPGDRCVFVGSLTVIPDAFSMLKPGEKFQMSANIEGRRTNTFNQGVTGLKSLGVQDLNYKMVFVTNNVLHTESRFGTTINIREDTEENIQESMTQAEKDEIRSMKELPGLYSMMARSICPMVYGNEEIKKGILLMLFGGVHKTTAEGIKLRGDLNICIVGDPSTAKSQFLKYIHGFLPRCVYTSGRASSAAGLTAAVQRDPETGEFTIEAGALMLADNGICCCDEFDKMEEKDQVAIHEAMEQQTISITKAGIQATLNARTSILAAANPIMGRYDKNKTLKNNLNISAPLMSRFDLFYVVCDQSDEQTDQAIARHILHTHQNIDETAEAPFTMQSLQRYIRFARSFKPIMTQKAAYMLRRAYVLLRGEDSGGQSNYRITVRQLESLVRLSEALARVSLSLEIEDSHVAEAARLLNCSILKVHKADYIVDTTENVVEQNNGSSTGQTNGTMAAEAPQKNKFRLTSEDYDRFALAFEHHIKDAEKKYEDADNFDGVVLEQLIETIISQNLHAVNTMEDYNMLTKVLKAVADKMVKDLVLMIAEDNEMATKRKLKIHPNYVSRFE